MMMEILGHLLDEEEIVMYATTPDEALWLTETIVDSLGARWFARILVRSLAKL